MNALAATHASESSSALFVHSGQLSEAVIATTSQSLRARLAGAGIASDRARKIFSSYVELAYNILHYAYPDSREQTTAVRNGDLIVNRSAAEYSVSARNRISLAMLEVLTARIEQLRSMSVEQIRFEYRLRLTNLQFENEQSASKGAGLGLLTVARNASRPLEYSVYWDPADQQTCLLSIHTAI